MNRVHRANKGPEAFPVMGQRFKTCIEVELVLVEAFPDPPTSAKPAGWGEIKRKVFLGP